jgi:hypothetical protein
VAKTTNQGGARTTGTKQQVVMGPKELARALEGIANSVLAVRKLVLDLPADAQVTVDVSIPKSPQGYYYDNPCPPPE